MQKSPPQFFFNKRSDRIINSSTATGLESFPWKPLLKVSRGFCKAIMTTSEIASDDDGGDDDYKGDDGDDGDDDEDGKVSGGHGRNYPVLSFNQKSEHLERVFN